MAGGGDEHAHDPGEHEESTPVEEVGVLAHLPEEVEDDEEREESHDGDDGLGARGEARREAAWPPDHRQGRAEEETHDVAVRAEVCAAGVGLLRVAVGDREESHPGGRGQGTADGDVEHPATAAPAEQDEGQRRPEEIELLLHGQ